MNDQNLRLIAALASAQYQRASTRELATLLTELRAQAVRRGLDDVADAIDAGIRAKVGPAGRDRATGPEDAQEG